MDLPRPVLFFGSRSWVYPEPIREDLSDLLPDTVVITGAASGADSLAEDLAREMGFHVAVIKPLWGKYGKRAGYLRNVAMASLNPFEAYCYDLGTPGTKMMREICQQHGIPVYLRTRPR